MVNQKAAMCKPQIMLMVRAAGAGVGEVALGENLGRLSDVDWAIQNWVLSARNAPLRGRRRGGEGEEKGRRRGGEGEERGRRGGGEGEEREGFSG
jgi:hypothetical protein